MWYNSSQTRYFRKKIRDFILDCLSDMERREYDKIPVKPPRQRNSSEPDMVLPKGCGKLGWNNSSLIKIECNVQYDTPEIVVRNFKDLHQYSGYDFILVYRQNPSIDFHDREDIRLITFSDLYKLVKTKQSFKGASPIQFTREIDKKKLRCKEAFNRGNCTLFVGAGVSMSANLPSWEDLLYKILENLTEKDVIKNEDRVFFKRAFDGSNMVMGRYLSTLSNLNSKTKSEVALIEKVKGALYPKEVNKDCRLINSIVNLVRCKKNEQRMVNRIITYNYDDLLECAISKSNTIFEICNSQLEYEEKYDTNKFMILHVHGIISNYYSGASNSSHIVFSEDSYHELYNDYDNWANKEQREVLERSTCLFIGMSMSDPNLRRLLDETKPKKGKPKHFAFLSEKDFFSTLSFLPQKDIVEEMFYELGVQVIWFNEFKELPDLLNSLIYDKQQNINQ